MNMEPINVEEAVKEFEGDLEKFIEEYIKNNLSIRIEKYQDYGSKGFDVSLILNNKEISSSYVATEYDRDF